MNAFIHLVSGESAGGVVRETLRKLKRREELVVIRDALNVGPLADVDAGGAARIEWWNRVYSKQLPPRETRKLDESAAFHRLAATDTSVVVWHGPHPSERLVLLRACWYLRDAPERTFEVESPPLQSRNLPPFYGSIAIASRDTAERLWEHRRHVADVDARAAEWQRVRATPGDWFRVLEGERLVDVPVTSLDSELVNACSAEWTSPSRVIGTVLVDHPIGDRVLAWRVRELLRAGLIEGRGEGPHSGLPAEVRTPSERRPSDIGNRSTSPAGRRSTAAKMRRKS
ncbi:MAG: DUF1835 domain-containing protein [Deltaproteobacteria bacterium]|nr:DUF1835 domain-containing protein [Deltaproteobacteria bacterium]